MFVILPLESLLPTVIEYPAVFATFDPVMPSNDAGFEKVPAVEGDPLNLTVSLVDLPCDGSDTFIIPDEAAIVSNGFQNPINFDGITGSNLSKAAGYSITVGKRDSSGNITNTENFYHFTVDTDTATTGGTSGGGKGCSSGPATLTA